MKNLKREIKEGIVGLVALILVGVGCAGALSATDLANLDTAEDACVKSAATKADADACRHKVHVSFCATHPGVGDMCAVDGGAK